MHVIDAVYRRIERMMRIAEDTKKGFSYNKAEGKWYWHPKHGVDDLGGYPGPFDSFVEALEDAVAPYVDGGEMD